MMTIMGMVPRMSQRRARAGRFGFTLVEVMIAMGILTVIMVAIYSCWSAILRGAKAGLTAAADVQRMRVAMRTVEEALLGTRMFAQNAVYYSFIVDTNGAQTAISFASHLPESFPRSGRYTNHPIRRVTFAVEEARDRTPQLVVRQHPLLTEGDADEDENPLVLARDVSLFALDFWGPNSKEWEAAWPFTNQLPKLVKVTLGFGRSGSQPGRQREIAFRIVALPAIPVLAEWQRPAGGPGGGRVPANQPPIGPGNQPGGRGAPLPGAGGSRPAAFGPQG